MHQLIEVEKKGRLGRLGSYLEKKGAAFKADQQRKADERARFKHEFEEAKKQEFNRALIIQARAKARADVKSEISRRFPIKKTSTFARIEGAIAGMDAVFGGVPVRQSASPIRRKKKKYSRRSQPMFSDIDANIFI